VRGGYGIFYGANLWNPVTNETKWLPTERLRASERYAIEIRSEAFNTLNHPNLNIPNQKVNAPAAAAITGARSPRLLQFGMRMQF
jgi:hypothetical protein